MSVLTRQTNISNYTVFDPWPVEIAIAPTGSGLGGSLLGDYVWNFDVSGSSFRINTSIAIRPYRFYAIYYDFSINVETDAVNLTDAVMNLSWSDFSGLIAAPILAMIPLNQYTLENNTVRFTGKYANNVMLFADYLAPNPNASPPGLSWDISLVQAPTGTQVAGLTNTTMTIHGFYAQEIGADLQALETAGLTYSSKRGFTVSTPH
jgi:hypothetical protein